MPAPLPWDDPASDPIADIIEFMTRWTPPRHETPMLVVPARTFERYSQQHLEQVAYETLGRRVHVLPNVSLSDHTAATALDYQMEEDDGG